ncbi:MAG: ATP synthase subunit I [Burkholderiales bacterium]|nr:ATP synthase subunit I [Burkholderiales bacterium]
MNPATGSQATGYAKAIGLQVLIAALMALVWGALRGENAGVSALAGGAISIIPSALFAWRLNSAARKGVIAFGMTFFLGELGKLALSAVLFAAVIVWYRDADLLALVVSYIVTLHAYLLALLVV